MSQNVVLKEEMVLLARRVNKSLKSAPCVTCERKGCGSFHDQCEKYQAFTEYRKQISRGRAAINEQYSDKIHSIRSMKKSNRSEARVFKSPKK